MKKNKTVSLFSKGFLFGMGMAVSIGMVFAVSSLTVNVSQIDNKESGDIITADDFNAIVGTLDEINNISGSIGIGKEPNPDISLDVLGGIRIGEEDSLCDENLSGTTRYNSVDKQLELCDGESWVAIAIGENTNSESCQTFDDPTVDITGKDRILQGTDSDTVAFCQENNFDTGVLNNVGDILDSDEEDNDCAIWKDDSWSTISGCTPASQVECCNGGSDSFPVCEDGQILAYNNENISWECASILFPDCEDGEALVKKSGEWTCKDETLLGKEKINLEDYRDSITVFGFNPNISAIYDDDSDTSISARLAATTLYTSHSCGYSYPDNTFEYLGWITMDLGEEHATSFGNYIASGDIKLSGGDNYYSWDNHVPNVSCDTETNSGGLSLVFLIQSSMDGVNWTEQGTVSVDNYSSTTNDFSLMGNISGRYVSVIVYRSSTSGIKNISEATVHFDNIEIYYDLF